MLLEEETEDTVDVLVHDYNHVQENEKRHDIKTSRGSLACFERRGALFDTVDTPFIITYHDLGVNHITCFTPFFDHPKMKSCLPYLNIIHIEAPGHQYNGETIPTDSYPTLHQMAEDITFVLQYFKIKSFIGIGSGAGGAVLTQFTVLNPKYVLGLILVGSAIKSFSYLELVKSWVGFSSLPSMKNPNSVKNYLLHNYYSENMEETNPDLYDTMKREMQMINSENLCHYVQSYLKREDISMEDIHKLNCKVLLIVGKDSSITEDVVELFSHFNPRFSTLLQIPNCGILVTAEKPGQLVEPFKLYMQGLGYLLDYYQSVDKKE
eukprot:gene13294-15626_t